ncbi:bifunctional riboflavin kinase/FAD synthetase [Sanguibacter antarcticus]|uniref:Riboflavin biosynthesis protein n=1 Tax=Sanguibacter antarcticus TaxID=372484 RepID=A0A2A9E3K1_9MICO|nr:bifunctional riboflavin kinase/FAD synthetase [Sanguibacter antarcticus]PFG33528.1 riboflavin kinase/FMN adenylyltransferase [Sanguibacter antarcticus]
MERWTGLEEVPENFGPSVVTIGNFDGVHRGHAVVLGAIVDRARTTGARAVAVTFDPHPAMVHRPHQAPPLICSVEERLELMAATGLDAVLLLEYTLDFARHTPEEFVQEYLVDGLGVSTVVVGRDVRFGLDNSGTLETMVSLGEKYGFEVMVVDDVGRHDESARWSSTVVRRLLLEGDVATASTLLGRHHQLRGVVVHGDARGRDLGFPTANLSQDASGIVPADGVYAGWLRRPRLLARGAQTLDAVLPAAVSIGTNPTFDGVQRRVEAYVLDRTDLELYDEEVVIELVERLRPTLRFDGMGPLVEQMHADVVRTREVLGLLTGHDTTG